MLGFLFTLVPQRAGDFAANFTNFLLFISYWIAPFVGVVLADWWLRGRRADVSRLSDFGGLPTGIVGIVALVVGFLVGIPFQNSTSGYGWGGPFNYVTANYLHGADIAYYVGGVVAAVIYIIGARKAVRAEADRALLSVAASPPRPPAARPAACCRALSRAARVGALNATVARRRR